MEDKYSRWVGIDWGMSLSQVCLLLEDGRVIDEASVEHSGAALQSFVDRLWRLVDGRPESVAVAIETPRGAIVESLLERGFHVYAINPKQADRFRDRYTAAGAKDDRRDAFVLADSLRTDLHCFRRVRTDDPVVIQIRELSRMEDELVQEIGRLANRLREQLHRFYPQMLGLCPAANEPWFWDLVELAPTPAHTVRLPRKRVTDLLSKNRIRSWTPDDVITQLRAPALKVAPGATEAAAEAIALLLPRIRLVWQQRSACAKKVAKLLDTYAEKTSGEGQGPQHRDVEILLSFPGVGRVVAATMLSEAAQALAERDYHALRVYSGVAPITRRSGKRTDVLMRRGCNVRLRNALYYWALACVRIEPASRATYHGLRQRGSKHGSALRTIGDQLLRVLTAMLRTQTCYNPALRHRVPVEAMVA